MLIYWPYVRGNQRSKNHDINLNIFPHFFKKKTEIQIWWCDE